MKTADQVTVPALEPSISASGVAETAIKSSMSHRQRLPGLLIVLAVAFLPSVVNSLSSAYREPLSNVSDAYIRYGYFNLLIVELTSLALLAYVIGQNGQKFSDFGFAFRSQDIAYGVLLSGAAACFYQLAYHPILSACQLLGWHSPAPYLQASPLGLGLLAYGFVLVNPIYEETIVRAFLISETAALSGSTSLAILASVLLQTSYHLYQGLPYALCAGVVFVIFSIYYAKTRHIVPVIIAHFMWDFSYLLAHNRGVHG